MAVTVYIPTPFRRATQNQDRVVAEAHDVRELLDRLEATYAGLRELVRNPRGRRPPPRQHLREQRGHRVPRRPGRAAARRRRGRDHSGPGRRAGMIVTAEELAAIHAQAVREYPHESCGIILTRGAERRVIPCRNIQEELHAKDPARHPRDARTAYYIDPQDLLRIGQLEGEGFARGRHLSFARRRRAPTSPRPIGARPSSGTTPRIPRPPTSWPRCAAARTGRRVDDTAAFRWDPARRDFAPVELSGARAPGREPRHERVEAAAARGRGAASPAGSTARCARSAGWAASRSSWRAPRARGSTTSTAGATSTTSAPGGR